MKILVVGGGTAGLVTASILKRTFGTWQIDVVKSDNIGIVGVGEGSTEHFKEYIDYIGVPWQVIIPETNATLKLGINFERWNTRQYWHGIDADFSHKVGMYHYVYGYKIANNNHDLHHSGNTKGLLNRIFVNNYDFLPANQFHFDTYKLNEFLLKICKTKFGIKIYTDDIKDVILDENGEIDTLIGDRREYDYDFYIDATGFKKLLIGKLGAKWESYSKYLKTNAAITFPTEDSDSYPLYTLARAMDYGWRFRIPVWGRFGNGYVFDSNHISADQAKEEVEKDLGREIEVGKQFSFDPGKSDRSWIKNCVAVGLSSNFIEPLEATSIGSTIQEAFLLMNVLKEGYSQKDIDFFNKHYDIVVENLRDFVLLHYMTKKTSTDFWREASSVELPDKLADNLETFKHKLPVDEYLVASRYQMFWAHNYIQIMEGLDLFDRRSIKKEFLSLAPDIQEAAEKDSEYLANFVPSYITHKKYIEIERNMYGL